MSRRMVRGVAFAALATVGSLFWAGAAGGGELTATFTATPSSLEEGGSSDLKLTLNYVPAPAGTGTETIYADRFRYDVSNAGSGAMTSLAGTIDCGQGDSIDVSTALDSLAHEVARRVAFDDPGVYAASISGTATVHDRRSATRFKQHPVHSYWMENGFVENYDQKTYALPIEASVEIAVANASPSIANIAWSPIASVGIPFSFAATASDPGGIAPDETIAFEFDLDDDGDFDDLRTSGSLVASGTHTLYAKGTHILRVRVTDGLGGSAEGSFSVLVGNGAPSVAPLQAAVAEFDGTSPEIEFSTEVADADGHPLTATWQVKNAGGVWETRKVVPNVASGDVLTFVADYPFGRSDVRLEVTDGYDATVIGTTVTVHDTENPILGIADDVRVAADPGKAFATGVTLPAPSVQDSSGRPVTLTNDAPTDFALGETIVIWTATDASGNRSTIQQKVAVEDREAPTVEGQNVVRVFTDPGKLFAAVDVSAPTAFDNVSDPSRIEIVSAQRSRFPIGRTLVVFRAIDEAGNFAEWKTTVVVVNRKPVARAGADMVVITTSEAGASVKLDGSRSTDPDRHALKYRWRGTGRVKLAPATAKKTAGFFPVGTTKVRLIVTDAAGASRTDVVKVTVKLRNAKSRPSGRSANEAFASATRVAQEAVASGSGGVRESEALIYANVAAGLGDVAGEYVRWEEGGSEADAALGYAGLRALQQAYGAAAANATLSAYAETGDESLLSAYGYAAYGVLYAQADLSE